MTPMVDLAFLLVTFFMLTTQFRPEEPVTVDTPSSIDSTRLPDVGVVTLTVAKDGRVFFDMSNENRSRELMIRNLNKEYNLGLSDAEMVKFSHLTTVGMPATQLKGWINASPSERSKIPQPGIPNDSTEQSELRRWILNARFANPNANLAVKGDRDAAYKVIRGVMKTIQGQKPYTLNKFYLLTSAEAKPTE
jgi:biopolymer transport protein ExbD